MLGNVLFLFAGANEPSVKDATEMAVFSSYYQTYINGVSNRELYQINIKNMPYKMFLFSYIFVKKDAS